MTQEHKELLLKDLCARLPYKVKVQDTYYKSLEPATIWLLDLNAQAVRLFADEGYQSIEYIKPYLFPLSSMTEEQYDELEKMTLNDYMDHMRITNELREKVEFITHWPLYSPDIIDWFNRNHFDYKGLIEKGLALDATNLNIY